MQGYEPFQLIEQRFPSRSEGSNYFRGERGLLRVSDAGADFIANFGHEWAGSLDSSGNREGLQKDGLDLTDMAWQFFAGIQSN